MDNLAEFNALLKAGGHDKQVESLEKLFGNDVVKSTPDEDLAGFNALLAAGGCTKKVDSIEELFSAKAVEPKPLLTPQQEGKQFFVFGAGNIIGKKIEDLPTDFRNKLLAGMSSLTADEELMRDHGDIITNVEDPECVSQLVNVAVDYIKESFEEPDFTPIEKTFDVGAVTESTVGWEGPDVKPYIIKENDTNWEENSKRYGVEAISYKDHKKYATGYCLVRTSRQVEQLKCLGVYRILTNRRSVLRLRAKKEVYRPYVVAASTGWYYCDLRSTVRGDIGLSRKGLKILKALNTTLDISLLYKEYGLQAPSHENPNSYAFRSSSEDVNMIREHITNRYLESSFFVSADLAGIEAVNKDWASVADYVTGLCRDVVSYCNLKYVVRNLWAYISANCMRQTRTFVYLYALSKMCEDLHYDPQRRMFFRSEEAAKQGPEVVPVLSEERCAAIDDASSDESLTQKKQRTPRIKKTQKKAKARVAKNKGVQVHLPYNNGKKLVARGDIKQGYMGTPKCAKGTKSFSDWSRQSPDGWLV